MFPESWYDEPELRDIFLYKQKQFNLPRVSFTDHIQGVYRQLRVNKVNHERACDAIRKRFFPSSIAAHVIGGNTNMFTADRLDFRQFPDEDVRKHYQQMAKESGVDTSGAMYHPSLARYIGDPMAWVKSDDDVKDRCKAMGYGFKRKGADVEIGLPVDKVVKHLAKGEAGPQRKKAKRGKR